MARPTGKRAANRIARTRTYLDCALGIVTSEGFDALTMQRIADDCDAAIGAIYRYFPSKGALVAEVQREAIDRLAASYLIIRERSDRRFAKLGLDEREAALARVVTFGRFFCATSDTFPQELRLLQMLMSEWRQVVPDEEGLRLVPTAMRFVGQAHDVIATATDLGVVDEGDALDRAVTWAAAVGGVLQISRLDHFDADLFDGERLARRLNLDLIVGWGADRSKVDRADALVSDLGARGPLAPPLPASSGTGPQKPEINSRRPTTRDEVE